jgi:hypothetical protein
MQSLAVQAGHGAAGPSRGHAATSTCKPDRVRQFDLEKTRVVHCKDDDRPGKHEHVKCDLLGYTFQPRRAKNRWGLISFLPAISTKAAKAIRQTIRAWRMPSTRNNQRLEDLARLTNPTRGLG